MPGQDWTLNPNVFTKQYPKQIYFYYKDWLSDYPHEASWGEIMSQRPEWFCYNAVVLITTPVENTLSHVRKFDILISYLDYAFEVKVSQKLNGDNRLTFNLPYGDEKGQEIVNENFIEYAGQKYIIKSVKDDDVQKIKTVEAEHVGLGLIDYWLHDTLDLPSVSAVVALEAILADTPYAVGTVNVTGVNDLEIEIGNKLKAVKTVQELWGGELIFYPPIVFRNIYKN